MPDRKMFADTHSQLYSWRASPSTRQNPVSRPHDRDRTTTPNNSRNQTNNRLSDGPASSQPQNRSTQSSQPPLPQNAWADRSRSQSGSLRGASSGPRGSGQGAGLGIGFGGAGRGPGGGGAVAGQAAGAGAADEKHVGVAGFNGEEVRDFLRRGEQNHLWSGRRTVLS